MVLLDYAWARYTVALGTSPNRAALWSMLLFLLGATVTRTYVAHEWVVVPATLGAGFGTWLGAEGKKP